MSAFDDLVAAYEGLEEPANFPTRAALEEYRLLLRERSREQAQFISSLLPRDCRVLEVGCGNGRLLMELVRKEAVAAALGLDLARSRIAFAREWAASEGLPRLQFEVADALRHPLPPCEFEAAICITGTFAYFDALSEGSALTCLERLSNALIPGGLLLLELYPHHRDRGLFEANGQEEIRIWKELPPEDPWRFYLSTLSVEGNLLIHKKQFVHRATGMVDQGRCERIRLYSTGELRHLLDQSRFHDIRFHAGWTDRPYDGEEILVVTALRASGPIV